MDPSTISELARQRLAALLGDGRPRREAPVEDGVGGEPGLRGFGRRHVGVLVGLLVIAVAVGGWTATKARATHVRLPSVTASPAVAAGAPSATPTPAPAPTVTVHVLGAVHAPGLVILPEGARVADAIAAAGGLAPGADPGELNLAEPVADGAQIKIGTVAQPAGEVRSAGAGAGGSAPAGNAGAPSGAGAKLDLNKATAAQLEQLPAVGPVTAQAIVAWREQHGRFTRIEELQEVDGIGPKTFAKLAGSVRV